MSTISDSRETILAKIKQGKPSPRPLPDIPFFDVAQDSLTNFAGHLKGFDGGYRMFAGRDEAVAWLKEFLGDTAKKVFSAIADISGNLCLADFATPAEMHVVDICIAEAILGVGETGSLLVDVKSLGNPAAALFSTDLFLLIDRTKILGSLQEAYAKINLADYQYSSFFSGPSATADIEAVHVTGAQGEISLTALIYNCSPEEMATDAEVPASTPLHPAISLHREADPSAGTDSI